MDADVHSEQAGPDDDGRSEQQHVTNTKLVVLMVYIIYTRNILINSVIMTSGEIRRQARWSQFRHY